MRSQRPPRSTVHSCVALMVLVLVGPPPIAHAQGHGPVFGLSTPTLGRGAWSLDLSSMGRVTNVGSMAMVRPMVSYGVTEDLQLSASLPIRIFGAEGPAPTRGLTRMPATRDIEVTLGWRLHRKGTAVGARFESTAYVSLDYPIDNERGGVDTAPGITVAGVTGYASRTIYAWVGGLFSRVLRTPNQMSDRVGNLVMYSVVFGYRPSFFRQEYPAPDWRIFLELVGESSAPDQARGTDVVNTGGQRVLLAPTVLGLYGRWGIAGGPALPIFQKLNGDQASERVRWVVNFIIWF